MNKRSKTAPAAAGKASAEVAEAAVKNAYRIVEALREPLEGAQAVLDLLLNDCEPSRDRPGKAFDAATPETVWHALLLVRQNVNAAKSVATVEGDSLMRSLGVVQGVREP